MLNASDYEALFRLCEETAGLPTLEAFLAALFEQMHAILPMPVVVFAHRPKGGAGRMTQSRGFSEEEGGRRYPQSLQEQLAFMEMLQGQPFGIASRQTPASVLDEFEVFQKLWPFFGIRESVAVPVGTPGEVSGLLSITLADRSAKRVERGRDLLQRLAPYVAKSLAHFADLERRGIASATPVDGPAAPRASFVVGPDGGVEWLSPAAQRLLAAGTGSADPPRALLEPCEGLRRAGASGEALLALGESARIAFPLGGRAIVARYKLLREGPRSRVLVTLEDPAGLRRDRLEERCRAFALSGREAEIAALVAQGLPNKAIAARLGIALNTVKNHLKRIFERAGAEGRVALVRRLLG